MLLQVVFHARLAAGGPSAPWSIDDVAGDLVDKLVRRHPHVFAGTSADDLEGTLGGAQGGREGPDVGHRRRAAVAAGAVAGRQAAEARRHGSAPRCRPSTGSAASCGSSCAAAATPGSTRRWRCGRRRAPTATGWPRRRPRVLAEGRDPAALTPQEWASRWA